jgi:hypothetical protein
MAAKAFTVSWLHDMTITPLVRSSLSIVLLVIGLGAAPALAQTSVQGGWSAGPTMSQSRSGAAAVRLANGNVIIIGGAGTDGVATKTVEMRANAGGAFVPLAPMAVARVGHTATLLADGRVVIAGGETATGDATGTVEIYNPAINLWSTLPQSGVARSGHTASLLNDGRVLLVGGTANEVHLSAVDLVSPAALTVTAATPMWHPRFKHAASTLVDGRVLVIGGGHDPELYEPQTGNWQFAGDGSGTANRYGATATRLSDGRVVVIGGWNGTSHDLATSVIFAPSTGTWTAGASMTYPRRDHAAVFLPGSPDRIFVVGGIQGSWELQTAEIFWTHNMSFSRTGPMASARSGMIAVTLQGGTVLVAGPGATSEVFNYATIGSATFTCNLQIVQPLVLAIPVDGLYSQQLLATNANGAVTWSVIAGTLPAGLTLSPQGLLSGRPTESGRIDFSVGARDAGLDCIRTAPAVFYVAGGTQRPNPGFTTNTLAGATPGRAQDSVDAKGRCDDCYKQVDLGTFRIAAGDAIYSKIYINNNGTISFTQPIPEWSATPFPLSPTKGPIIAPYFADVDTRNTAPADPDFVDWVTYGFDEINGRRAFAINWQNVGRYNLDEATRNSFQMVIVERTDLGDGAVDIEFNYGALEWLTGSAVSSNPPVVGFDFGNGADSFNALGSGTLSMLELTTKSNTIPPVPGRQEFFIRPGCTFVLTAPTITNAAAGEPYVGQFSTTLLVDSLGLTRYMVNGSLPPGLTLSNDGVISGTPTTVGTFTISVTAARPSCISQTASYTLVIAPGTATISLAGLAQTYTGAARVVTATTTPSGLPVTITYNGSSTAPTSAGSYTVVATTSTSSFAGTTTATMVVSKAAATVTLGNLEQYANGNPRTVTATTTPAGMPVTILYNGSATPPSAAGSYPVVATASNANYEGTASAVLTIVARSLVGIALTGLQQTYDGTPKSVTATTNPAGLPVFITYAGSATPPTQIGSYQVTAVVSTLTHEGVAQGTLVIAAGASVPCLLSVRSTAITTISLGQPLPLRPFQTSGAAGTPVYQLTQGSLPAGLTFTSAGTFSGAPTALGSYPITVSVTDPAAPACVRTASTTIQVIAGSANAIRPMAGFAGQTLVATNGGRCDDCRKEVDLAANGWLLKFGAATHSKLWVDNNGIVIFSNSLQNPYVGLGALPRLDLPTLLAPYHADVDTLKIGATDPNPDWTTYGFDYVNGHRAFGVNWFNVGAYSQDETKRNTFQLVIIEREDQGPGVFDVEFNYGQMQWLNGSFDTSPPLVGYQFGNGPGQYMEHLLSRTPYATQLTTATNTVPPFPGRLEYKFGSAQCQVSINPPASMSATVGQALSLPFTTTSTNAGTPAFSAIGLPPGVFISPAGNLAGTPTAAGSYLINITASSSDTCLDSETYTLTVAKGSATVQLSNLSQAADGSPRPVTVTTVPAGLPVVVTYAGSASAPTGSGTYAVVATVDSPNYTGSTTGTLTIGKSAATVTLGSLAQVYNTTPRSATATTTPSGLTVNFTYNGSSTPPTNAGEYAVVATASSATHEGTASGTLVVSKASATVTLGSLTQTYNGSARSATATTAPAGMTVNFTYNGSSTAPTSAGTYAVVGTISNANYTGSANGTLTIDKAAATVTLGSLTQTYNGSARSATAITAPADMTVNFTYNGSSTAPTGAGIYAVVGTISNANYTGSASGTLTIDKATATVTLGSLTQTYNGSARSATATTSPAAMTVNFTYNGSSTAPTSAGTYAVVGTIANANYTGSASGTLTIDKATATVTLGSLSQTYDGSARNATATTAPAGMTVNFTYNGSSTAPTSAGTYAVVGTISNANYIGTASGTLTIDKATATVTLGSLTQTYNGSARSATATTSPAGMTVNFTYNGSSTAPTGAGTYAVVGTIANANYTGSANGTLTIDKATATVTLGSLSQTYNGSTRSATATTSPAGMTVNFTYEGSPTAPTNAGSYAVVGTISNANYTGTASGMLTIDKATATVTLGSLTQTHNGSARSATATTAPAGMTVNFTYNGSSTAPTSAGTYAVVGTISNANYTGSASGTLTIDKATATVTLGSLTQTYNGSARSATATTSPAGMTVNFTYEGSPTAPTNAGSYAVVGTISNANYSGSASGTLTIDKATATVTLGSLVQAYNGSARSATATTSPAGMTVNFTYNGSSTAPTGAGAYAVVGTIANANYTGSANGTLTIDKATATVTLGSLTQTYNGSARSATATTSPAGMTTNFTYDGGATAPTTAGSYAVVATVADANYEGTATGTLTIGKATASIALANLVQTFNGSARVASASTTPAGLTVNLTYDGGATAPSNAGSYTVGATIADANYEGTTTGTLTIGKAAASIALANLAQTFNGSARQASASTTPAGLTVNLTYDGAAAAPTNAGSYAVAATIADANFEGSTTGTLSIGKATASIALANLAQTFNGSARQASASTTPSGLTVNFAYDGGATAPTNAGSYAVVATIADGNYEGTATGTLTIGKASASIALGDLAQTFNGSARQASALTTPAGLTVNLTYDGAAAAPTNAGSYAVVATIVDANFEGSTTGTLTIGKATASIALANLAQTFNGSARQASASTTPSGLTVNLAYDGGATAPTNAGSYAVAATIADANYEGSTTGTLTIGKASASIALADLAQTFNGSARQASASTTPSGLTVNLTYDGGATAPTNAGSYDVAATIADANYEGSTTGTLTIGKAAASMALANLAQTFNGSARPASASTTPAGLTVNLTYGGAAAAPTNAGSYDVVATIADANYEGSATGTLTIGKATASIALADLAQTFNGSARQASASTTPAGLTVNLTYDGAAAAPTNAGSYDVGATVTDNNYEGSATGTLTIGKATALIALADLSRTFTGSALGVSGTTTPAGLTVEFTYDGAAVAPANAGDYAVVARIADANYEGAATGTLVIEKAPLAVTIGSATRIYGAANPVFALSYSGFVNGDTEASLDVPVSTATTATAASNVGTYTITASGGANRNYAVTFTTGTLAVTQAPLTITATDQTKLQGQQNPPFTVSYSGFVNNQTAAVLSGTLAITTTATQTSAAGSYPITASGVSAGNYAIAFVPGTLTVEEAETPGQMSGDGFVRDDQARYSFGFSAREWEDRSRRTSDDTNERARVSLRIDEDGRKAKKSAKKRDDRFESRTVEFMSFSDDPTLRPGRARRPQVDTVLFGGVGEWNGQRGYRYEVFAQDAGEPGRHRETIRMTIWSSSGQVVAQFEGDLDGGNIQSKRIHR